MNKFNWLTVSLILLLAFFLRFNRLTEIPPSLNWDEVSIGYNAYSILKTGKDEWGQTFPLHFKSYGEYKLPGQIYASIPAIAVFGLNPFGVRITPVIYGTLTVLLLYFLAKEIFKSRSVGLVSAFLLAISPWHIQLTRGSFESSFALFWVVMGMLLLIKGFKDQRYWILSSLPFAAAIYTYNSARAFVPLFLLAVVFLFRKEILKYRSRSFVTIGLFGLLMIPLALFMLSGEGSARYKLVSVTDDAGLVPRIEERRNSSKLPAVFTNLIHNRVTYTSFYVAGNYLSHFTPDYLFLNGAPHKQHHVQKVGQMFAFQAPFVLIGAYLLFKKKNGFRWLILAWLLLAFMPASFTQDSIPHALRTLNAAPVYALLTAFGVVEIFNKTKKVSKFHNFSWLLVGLIALIQFGSYWDNLNGVYPHLYSRDWQYGNKQAVEYIANNVDDYDLIVYTREYGEPHMFTLFYLNYDPARFQNDPTLERFETFDWVRVLRFDKFYFPDLGDEGSRIADVVAQNPGKRILFISTPEETSKDQQILKTIHFLDGKEAFRIHDNI